ncbi:MAG: hypothetical protein ACPGUE_09850 [Marinomonas sp.]
MRITNPETLRQALANNRLESRKPSKEVLALLEKALSDPTITTTQVFELLRKR